MFLFVTAICILFVATSCQKLPKSNIKHQHNDGSVMEVHSYKEKTKRAAVKPIVALLSSAKRLWRTRPIPRMYSMMFVKTGGYQKALKDFKSLKPTNVQTIGYSKRGTVGSDEVELFKNAQGETWIYIKSTGRRPDDIVVVFERRIRYDD